MLQARVGFTCLNHFSSSKWNKLHFVESRQGLVQGQQTAASKDVYITASQGTSWQAHVAVESGLHTAMATDFMAIHNVTSFRLIGTNE